MHQTSQLLERGESEERKMQQRESRRQKTDIEIEDKDGKGRLSKTTNGY